MVSTTKPSPGDGPRIDDGSERADDGRHETREERLDRNTTEMVQELRVGAVGVQVLFAFLLVVPFNAGWKLTTGFEHGVYYVTLICIAVATVLLIAPSVHHRMLFRAGGEAVSDRPRQPADDHRDGVRGSRHGGNLRAALGFPVRRVGGDGRWRGGRGRDRRPLVRDSAMAPGTQVSRVATDGEPGRETV